MPAPVPKPPSLRRNALVNLIGRGSSLVLWIAVTPFVLARLGAERFGIWSLFFALTSYAAALDLGMASGTPRFLAACVARGDREGARHVLGRSLALGIAMGALWLLACLWGRGAFLRAFHVPAGLADETGASLAWFGLSLLAFSVAQVFQGVLIGFQRMDLSNLWFAAGLAANVAVLVTGVNAGLGLRAAAFGTLAGALVSGALSALSVGARLRSLPVAAEPARVSWRQMLGFSGTVQLTNLCIVGQVQVGKVLVGLLGHLGAVARYELGFRVANAVWSVPTLVQAAMFPAAAHAQASESLPRVREIYDWGSRWVFALAGWVFGTLWVTAEPLLRLWLGATVDPPLAVARGLTLAFAFATIAGPATMMARGCGWPGFETAFYALALALNLGLGAWLVRSGGIEGAALATAISFAVAAACVIPVLHRRLSVPTPRWLGQWLAPRLVPATLAAAAIGFLPLPAGETRLQSLASVSAGALAFAALYGLLLIPSGDPQTVWSSGRAWLAGAAGARRDRRPA